MSVCIEGEWADKYSKYGWNKFFEIVPKRFEGREKCDCIRTDDHLASVENRYYYNPTNNFTMTFLMQTFTPLSGHLPINYTANPQWVKADMLKPVDWRGKLDEILPTVKKSHGEVD